MIKNWTKWIYHNFRQTRIPDTGSHIRHRILHSPWKPADRRASLHTITENIQRPNPHRTGVGHNHDTAENPPQPVPRAGLGAHDCQYSVVDAFGRSHRLNNQHVHWPFAGSARLVKKAAVWREVCQVLWFLDDWVPQVLRRQVEDNIWRKPG